MKNKLISAVFAIGITVCLMGNTIFAEESEQHVEIPDTGNINAACFIVPATLALVTIVLKKRSKK